MRFRINKSWVHFACQIIRMRWQNPMCPDWQCMWHNKNPSLSIERCRVTSCAVMSSFIIPSLTIFVLNSDILTVPRTIFYFQRHQLLNKVILLPIYIIMLLVLNNRSCGTLFTSGCIDLKMDLTLVYLPWQQKVSW